MDSTAPHWSDDAGGWIITRYDDVMRVLVDTATFSSSAPPADFASWFLQGRASRPPKPMSIVGMDPPEHTALRRRLMPMFSIEHVRAVEARADAIAIDLLSPIASRGYGDLVDEFTIPFPLMLLAEFLGIDPRRHRDYRKWAETVARLESSEQTEASSGSRAEHLRDYADFFNAFGETLTTERRASPLGRLVENGDVSIGEAVTFAKLLLLAGTSTTSHLIANAVARLGGEDRARLEHLAQTPADITPFVEETLALEPPVQSVARVTTAEVAIGSVTIPAGARVLAMLEPANRERPAGARHLSMGSGPHGCPGAELGRREATVAMRHLVPLLARGRIDVAAMDYHRSFRIRSPKRLLFTANVPESSAPKSASGPSGPSTS